jgi:hypothetical protein
MLGGYDHGSAGVKGATDMRDVTGTDYEVTRAAIEFVIIAAFVTSRGVLR